ncbi:hypothetical protein SRABI118_00633 [Massilia sp. Bi118]|uniref:hypothetical protein n=1 Tax=Massilia sp. Bi118 TaxID=2822346 RepID=UPI001D41A8D5|nr:hypothetical protein [Massilia sp. Bi118]CAH0155922.1 hypothetical protein SRABI118_00633 [Massilia sp. Bi118]
MPRIPTRLPLLALLLAAQAGIASAQQSTQPAAPQSNQQPSKSEAPPKLERVEPGSDVPATNIPSRTRTQIKETRGDGGQVTEVEVNSSGSHYYMKPNNPPGAVPAGPGATATRAPQWKVGEFDLSGKRKAASETGTNTPTTADAPPPPALPANATAGPEKK